MKEKMNKNWLKLLMVIVFLGIVGAGLFYWYEIRPSQIKQECFVVVNEKLGKIDEKYSVLDWQRLYDLSYGKCLNSHGLQ